MMAKAIAMKFPDYVIDVDAVINDPVNRRKLGRYIVKRHLDMDKIIEDFIHDPKNEAELQRFAASIVFSKTGEDMAYAYDADVLPLFYESVEAIDEVSESSRQEDNKEIIDHLDLL